MFDHISLGVSDLERATAFYDAVLAPLGYSRKCSLPRASLYGPPGTLPEEPFGIVLGGAAAHAPGSGFHLAFSAPSREAVDRFHAAAVLAGGLDEGGPGIRVNYGPGYYAAFVRDPDGYRLEAVLHEDVTPA